MEASASDFQRFPRERNQSMHRWVYNVLRLNIIRLHLKPGQAISETEISSLLGISRTPVREAFIRLGEDGLLEVRPQRCSVISRIDLEQAEETRFVRRSLEKSILKEAYVSFPPSGTAELEANLAEQAKCIASGDFEGLLSFDDEFHRIIYRACGKERIWSFIKKLDYSHDRLRTMTLPLIGERILSDHKEISRLLAERDGGAIDELVDRHLTNAIISKVILNYPAEFFRQNPRDYSAHPILVD